MYRLLPMFMFAFIAVAQHCRYESYESVMLDNDDWNEFIPPPVAFECRISRLGNPYEVAVPHPILQNKINKLEITVSNKIDASLHSALLQTIRDGISQRINPGVLWKILTRKEFATRVMIPDEFVPEFNGREEAKGVNGYFDYATLTLGLNIATFVDEAWTALFVLGNELSHASYLALSDEYSSIQEFNRLVAPALEKDWDSLENIFNRLEKEAKKINGKFSPSLQKYIQALTYYHPNVISNSNLCENFKRKIVDYSIEKNSTYIVTHTNKVNGKKIYYIDDSANNYNPYYKHGCGSLFFFRNPLSNSTLEKIRMFKDELLNHRANIFGIEETAADLYKSKASFDQYFMEDASNVDSYDPEVKQAFFPKYCEAKTKAMHLTRNYCSR